MVLYRCRKLESRLRQYFDALAIVLPTSGFAHHAANAVYDMDIARSEIHLRGHKGREPPK